METLQMRGTYVSYIWLLQMLTTNKMTKFCCYKSLIPRIYAEKVMLKKQDFFFNKLKKHACEHLWQIRVA